MDIKDYIWKHRLTIREFAEQIGCTYAAMQTYVAKKRIPSRKYALKIEEVTNREVSLEEILTGRYKPIKAYDFFRTVEWMPKKENKRVSS